MCYAIYNTIYCAVNYVIVATTLYSSSIPRLHYKLNIVFVRLVTFLLCQQMLEEYEQSEDAQQIKLVQVIKQARIKKNSGKK